MRDRRHLLVTGIAAVAISWSGTFLVACRRDAPPSTVEDAGVTNQASSSADAPSATADELADASGGIARGLEARAEEARRDAGAIDRACEGATLGLLAAAVDPRCAVTEREWSELTRAVEGAGDDARAAGARRAVGAGGSGAGTKGGLRQQARREGDAIVLSIVNEGKAPILVPLRYHPGHPELAFSVLAEVEGRGLFELAAPGNDAPAVDGAAVRPKTGGSRGRPPPRRDVLAELDAGPSRPRVHSARIRLLPGGALRARLTIDPRIVKRLDRTCAERGPQAVADGAGDASAPACLPARLPRGRVVLHVGQLVTAIDAGEPARVEWDAP